MLEYEWRNQSTSENDGGAATEPDQQPHRQIFNHLPSQLPQHFPPTINIAPTSTTADFSTYHNHNNNDFFITSQPHHPFFDPRAFLSASSTNSFSPTLSHSGLGLGLGLLHMSKSEDLITRPMEFGSAGALGLNLGGRTYFATSNDVDDDALNYFYRHSTAVETCSRVSSSSNRPRCQAEGCNADLSNAKQYHRRHKVCEFHSKAATVVAAGLTQRFCQQCSRFHVLSEFDNGKRSCRKRLADHNRRRRKLQKQTQVFQKSQPTLVDNVARSSPRDSGAQSSSSVMAAIPATIIPK